MLWPDVVRAALKTGHDREIVAVYPHRSAVPRTLWRDLISRAQQRLDFAGFTNYFLWLEHPGLHATLRRKAEAGAEIRWIIGDPDSQVTAEREQVEAVPLTVSTRIKVSLDELSKLHQGARRSGHGSPTGTSACQSGFSTTTCWSAPTSPTSSATTHPPSTYAAVRLTAYMTATPATSPFCGSTAAMPGHDRTHLPDHSVNATSARMKNTKALECSHRKDAPLKRGRTLVMGDGGGQHRWGGADRSPGRQ